jgi:Family of unknown function (DUF5941)
MSAATVSRAAAGSDRSSVLEVYRDDGPLAAAIGAAAGRVVPLNPVALPLVAAVPLFAVIAATGDGAPRGVVAGAVAWVVVLGGLASARPLSGRLRWTVPPALRGIELGALLWMGAVAGSSSAPAAFALLCAIVYHHYDTVYGMRHRGVTRPRWVRVAGGGWDGRLLVAVVLLLAGALPAGFFVMAGLLAVLFVGETITEWRRVGRAQRPVYDDEEDEAD